MQHRSHRPRHVECRYGNGQQRLHEGPYCHPPRGRASAPCPDMPRRAAPMLCGRQASRRMPCTSRSVILLLLLRSALCPGSRQRLFLCVVPALPLASCSWSWSCRYLYLSLFAPLLMAVEEVTGHRRWTTAIAIGRGWLPAVVGMLNRSFEVVGRSSRTGTGTADVANMWAKGPSSGWDRWATSRMLDADLLQRERQGLPQPLRGEADSQTATT